MAEYLDILDIEGNPTGESREFSEVHKEGLLHRSAHVWIVNSNGEVLLQKRSSGMWPYPSHWDMSAAGHVSSGQSSIESARRETEEELGICIKEEEFIHVCTLKQVVSIGEWGTDNEFQDVYVVHKDVSVEEVSLQENEVEQVAWVPLSDIEMWVEAKGEKLTPHKEEQEKIREYVESIEKIDKSI